MKSLKEKVAADLLRQKNQRKQLTAEYFKENKKIKPREFPRKKVNMERYFHFPKFLYSCPDISKSALAVYPVLCSLADFEKNEWFYVSQEDLSKMSGISIPQVRSAVDELINMELDVTEDLPFLKMKKVTDAKRHFYMYQVGFIRQDMIEDMKGRSFLFHTCIIDSGVWAKLKPRAKALYLALRTTARFDFAGYIELELDIGVSYYEAGMDEEWMAEIYRNRKWEPCNESLAELCRMVNIEPTGLKPVLEQLEHYRLLERCEGVFKVYLKPRIKEESDVN